jgi:gliding motility-associated-like protein
MRLSCLTFLLLLCGGLRAQPANDACSDATTLCAGQPMAGNNTGSQEILPSICPPGGDLIWYTFTTNSLGGEVLLHLTGIDCLTSAGMDNEISVVVLTFLIPCNPGTYSTVQACEQDSVDFDVQLTGLSPMTQYWVVVSGMMDNGATAPANCAFNILMDGPGADIVGVDFSAGPDVTLELGGSTQLLATGPGTLWDWSPISGLSGNGIPDPFAQPNESTTYTVTTGINGCIYSDDVFIEVNRPINPPNTITPNGDGINDTWDLFGIQDYPQATITIYDRWGQKVFSSVGYKEPFDGKGLPTATYYWVIQLSRLEGVSEPYTGFLTIVN